MRMTKRLTWHLKLLLLLVPIQDRKVWRLCCISVSLMYSLCCLIEVSKWTTEHVVSWARATVPDLMESDAAVLKNQRVDGPSLVGLTYGINYAFPIYLSIITRVQNIRRTCS
jgi:hypothetical protein